jgi:hypothetical protein
MNIFLTSEYRLFPSLSEVRDHRNYPAPGEIQIGDEFTGKGHPVWDSVHIAVFLDGTWKVVGEEEFGELVDGPGDCPFACTESRSYLVVGVSRRTEERQIIDYSWLSEQWELLDDDGDLLVEAAKEMSSKSPIVEAYASVLYKVEWHRSVDWETGVDEGNFEIVESIFNVEDLA